MRPKRVEMEGFTTFRDLTVVDFTDADLFALTGPTGSGKSSVIDAMVFALYGCIPRLDQKSVAPLVSLGANEAKVRLDFTVAGDEYTAVRVVRRPRSGKGASTKEARLERADGEVLAGNERELSAAVEELLGLRVDDFTKCVVLPQGEFQEFLHAARKDRQELLVKLLDLGLYDRMARAARQRESAAQQQAEVAEALVAKLSYATEEARVDAARRAKALTELRAEVEASGPELTRWRDAHRAAEADAQAAREKADAVATVAAPEHLADQARALAQAQSQAAQASAHEETVVAQAEEAEAALSSLPQASRLEAALAAHRSRAAHLEQQSEGEALLVDRRAAEQEADVAARAGAEALVAAGQALETARWEHRAHDLAARLEPGKPCPVCRQEVGAVVDLADLGGGAEQVEAAVAAHTQADARARRGAQALAESQRSRREVELKLASIAEQLEALHQQLADHPDVGAVEASLARVEAAGAEERRLRQVASMARRNALATRRAVEELRGQEELARRAFNRVQADLAPLGPPPGEGLDLLADWEALSRWATEQQPLFRAESVEASTRAEQAEAEQARIEHALLARCGEAGVDLGRRVPMDAVADALAAAAADVRRIDEAMTESAGHRNEAAARRRAAEVAHELGRHLSANHFEKWMLDEALSGLTARATELLNELSAGAYSLTLDPATSNFAVIDHRNADQERSARTLSGGETFLASLALALALADELGSLAARGSAQLESIFLDEGFGTLDPDTLDTVASAIEELGARGRMVGLVSHVADLAERVPVRFEVRREPGSSTVTKVVA